MPQVKIREVDLTNTPMGEHVSFAVVVPGKVVNGTAFAKVADENGVYACSSQKDFVNNVGIANSTTIDSAQDAPMQIGNQIAYELLGLGYPVLYKKLESTAAMEDDEYWEALNDRASYDFRFIITGLLDDNKEANDAICKVAHRDDSENADPMSTGRGDCIALVDIDESVYKTPETRADRAELLEAIVGEANGLGTTCDKYAAVFAPSVCLLGTDAKYTNNKFPASFYYLACFKYALDNGFAEWYAAAGYTRGICKYTVEAADVNFGEYLINALEPRNVDEDEEGALKRAVNVVAKIRGNYYLWGNRTAYALGEELKASHFLNIRNLCSSIKQQLYYVCRRFTFDPNSDVLWINFCNAIKPTLERMKADQGIKDYKIVKLYTAKKAELKARVRIIPIEAVEDFDITISLEDNFGEAVANVSEE